MSLRAERDVHRVGASQNNRTACSPPPRLRVAAVSPRCPIHLPFVVLRNPLRIARWCLGYQTGPCFSVWGNTKPSRQKHMTALSGFPFLTYADSSTSPSLRTVERGSTFQVLFLI